MSDTLKFRRDEDNSMIDSRRDDIVLKTLMNDKFMEFIEEQIGYPITMVSNGPSRDDIIYRESKLSK